MYARKIKNQSKFLKVKEKKNQARVAKWSTAPASKLLPISGKSG
jgi:hypothetical protein